MDHFNAYVSLGNCFYCLDVDSEFQRETNRHIIIQTEDTKLKVLPAYYYTQYIDKCDVESAKW